jgi:hypothetical protein
MKKAMINTIKDSFIILILGGIFYVAYLYMGSKYDDNTVSIAVLVFVVIIVFSFGNIVAALGATLCNGDSYEQNKKRYKQTIFTSSSFFFQIKLLFFITLGVVFYPIAILVSIVIMKELFNANTKEYVPVNNSENMNYQDEEKSSVTLNVKEEIKNNEKTKKIEKKEVGYLRCHLGDWDNNIKIHIHHDGSKFISRFGIWGTEYTSNSFDEMVDNVKKHYKNSKDFRIIEIKKF